MEATHPAPQTALKPCTQLDFAQALVTQTKCASRSLCGNH